MLCQKPFTISLFEFGGLFYALALDTLTVEERLLIHELFFNGKSERILAGELGVPRMTLSDRKHRILRKMRKVIED